jgi:hypothetical protein
MSDDRAWYKQLSTSDAAVSRLSYLEQRNWQD